MSQMLAGHLLPNGATSSMATASLGDSLNPTFNEEVVSQSLQGGALLSDLLHAAPGLSGGTNPARVRQRLAQQAMQCYQCIPHDQAVQWEVPATGYATVPCAVVQDGVSIRAWWLRGSSDPLSRLARCRDAQLHYAPAMTRGWLSRASHSHHMHACMYEVHGAFGPRAVAGRPRMHGTQDQRAGSRFSLSSVGGRHGVLSLVR